jgi:hypothetical protein
VGVKDAESEDAGLGLCWEANVDTGGFFLSVFLVAMYWQYEFFRSESLRPVPGDAWAGG